MSGRGVLAVAGAALLESACLVQVTRVADADPVFREARAEAQRHGRERGPARELNVLVWEADEGQLVRVRVPIWLVRAAYVAHAAERDHDWDWDHGDVDRIEKRLRGRVRLEDIEKMGPGVVAEVETDEREQVLVWLR